ncbi:MAG: hypothetical protein GF401_01865 [Chitinivibrionales bacterium]|nr:hypothetical protein [Chitinivibrionales bacterium]
MKNKWTYAYRWFMWNIVSFPLVEWLKINYNLSMAPGSGKFPTPPFFVISNHNTFFDPWILGGHSMSPFAIMCNDDAFRGSVIQKWYLNSIGAFPKKKGASDFSAMKKTITILKNGYAVCIFPEGQTSWDGETQLIYKGLEKIIQRARCPLMVFRLQGNFLTKPWWAKSRRKGKILMNTKIIPAEEIGKMSSDELLEVIKREIYQNDIKDEKNRATCFRGHDMAEGLERFIWICMQCEKEDTLITKGNEISCLSCGKKWYIDAHCKITAENNQNAAYEDLKDWSEWHKNKVKSKIKSTSSHSSLLTSSSDVLFQTEESRHSFADRGKGTLELTSRNIIFKPEDRSGRELEFPLDDISNYVIQKKDIFECTYKGNDYRFVFNHHSPMKWVFYVRYLKGYEELEEKGYIE